MATGNRVYIVEVINFGSQRNKISQTGYRTYDAAVAFIVGRFDNPKQITKYCFKSDEYDYVIHDVLIL